MVRKQASGTTSAALGPRGTPKELFWMILVGSVFWVGIIAAAIVI